MKKILIIILSIAASISFLYSSAEAIVHVEGRYWFTSLDSKVQVTETGLTGTELNLVDTLGMGDKNFLEARIDLNLFDHHLRYGYMPMSWKGQKTMTQDIYFSGQTYSASVPVDSKLDVLYQRLGYEYDIINLLGNKLGVIVDLKLLSIDASLKTTGIDKSYSITAPVPTIGLTGQVGLSMLFTVGAEVTGIAYSGNHLIDGEVSVNFEPIPFTTISGGYRIFDLKLEDGDNKVDFALNGPFLMVKVGW